MTIRVLQVCPFGIPDEPNTGGQIRIQAIAQAYQDWGCIVDRCCIVTRPRDVNGQLDILLPWQDRIRRKHLGKPDNLGQIRQHWASKASHNLQSQLSARLNKQGGEPYQIVQVEHPWDAHLLISLKSHPMIFDARIVYSAHNIEHELFESVAKEAGYWNRAAERLAEEIRSIETMAASVSDLTWAVSEYDQEKLSRFSNRCIVAPNGCRQLPKHPLISRFSEIKSPYALFIGTNYAPNIKGFLSLVGDDLSYLPSGTSIHTIGSCAELLQKHPAHQPSLRSGQITHHGKLSQAEVDSALLNADVILLPILSGGGTNLKTAEALAAGRQIIGTSHAFRGFEQWQGAPGVQLADKPDIFRNHLSKVLASPQMYPPMPQRNELCWSAALRPALEQTLGTIFRLT